MGEWDKMQVGWGRENEDEELLSLAKLLESVDVRLGMTSEPQQWERGGRLVLTSGGLQVSWKSLQAAV